MLVIILTSHADTSILLLVYIDWKYEGFGKSNINEKV